METLDIHRGEAASDQRTTLMHSIMLLSRCLTALCVTFALLRGTAGDIYALSAFDTVQIDNLLNNEATVVITPSFDGSYSLNASMPGLSYTVNTQTDTLELSQQALALDPVSGLLSEVMQPGIYHQDESAGNTVAQSPRAVPGSLL